MNSIIKELWNDESGVTAIEYGLIAGLMASVLVVTLTLFGDKLKELFAAISDKIGETTENISND